MDRKCSLMHWKRLPITRNRLLMDSKCLSVNPASEHPSPALRAPSPLLGGGERDGVRGAPRSGSWSQCAACEPWKLPMNQTSLPMRPIRPHRVKIRHRKSEICLPMVWRRQPMTKSVNSNGDSRMERDCVRRTSHSGWRMARGGVSSTRRVSGRAAAGRCHSRAPGKSGGGPPQSKTLARPRWLPDSRSVLECASPLALWSTPTELQPSAQRWRDEGAATLGDDRK